MLVEWLEILAGVIGAIGVIAAFVLGYRAPRTTEPRFELRFGEPGESDETVAAALVAENPGDQPIILRALVIQNPDRGLYFLSDGPGRRDPEAAEVSDVLAVDMEILPEQASEIDFYVAREPRSSARELVIDVEFSTSRTPSVVRSETLRARLPRRQAERRRTGLRERTT